jgi:hypothetical protein
LTQRDYREQRSPVLVATLVKHGINRRIQVAGAIILRVLGLHTLATGLVAQGIAQRKLKLDSTSRAAADEDQICFFVAWPAKFVAAVAQAQSTADVLNSAIRQLTERLSRAADVTAWRIAHFRLRCWRKVIILSVQTHAGLIMYEHKSGRNSVACMHPVVR